MALKVLIQVILYEIAFLHIKPLHFMLIMKNKYFAPFVYYSVVTKC